MASKIQKKTIRALKRRKRVRGRVFGTSDIPRMTVAKSLKNVTVQIIDDQKQITLLGLGTNSKVMAGNINDDDKGVDRAKKLGQAIAEMAIEKGIQKIVFDRNKNRFHGRIKAVADGAREKGLKF